MALRRLRKAFVRFFLACVCSALLCNSKARTSACTSRIALACQTDATVDAEGKLRCSAIPARSRPCTVGQSSAWLEWHTRRRAFGFGWRSPNGDELIVSSFAARCATRLQPHCDLPPIAHVTSSSL